MGLATNQAAGGTKGILSPLNLIIFSTILPFWAVVPAAIAAEGDIPSQCHQQEQVIFSCKVSGSKKIVSVCASKSLEGKNGYIQYRFGTTGDVELQFPSERAESVEKFNLSHYFRAGVDRWELSFVNKTVEYVVFTDLEAEERPSRRSAGISVNSGRIGKTLYCGKRYVQNFHAIEDVVRCNPNLPLSCSE